MECYYHPGREGTANCAICGKSVCKECSLEIAGKIYCKECLEKIIGITLEKKAQEEPQVVEPQPVEQKPLVTESPEINTQNTDDNIYKTLNEDNFEIPYNPQEEVTSNEIKSISGNSPYNIKDNIKYSGGLESSYNIDSEIYQQPPVEQEPQIAQNELDMQQSNLSSMTSDDFIYPDHNYEPPKTTARQELEDKYEKYLDDLYFDENEIPLGEQLAKDEAQYGSLTRKEYVPKPKEVPKPQAPVQVSEPKIETPEEMEDRIRAEILKEQGLMTDELILKEESKKESKHFGLRHKNNDNELPTDDKNIHNLNYKNEKEPMGAVDILLTIILIIVILIVIYYIVYLFLLSSTYPTFMDAIFAIRNPQNIINTILTQL
ncbi:MAG: ATPase [Methanobrevibacter sp.]|uniref:ATPase n=1 Tax=Methanobrevibacter sp. TaxID=66852 RepID=UPI003EFD0297